MDGSTWCVCGGGAGGGGGAGAGGRYRIQHGHIPNTECSLLSDPRAVSTQIGLTILTYSVYPLFSGTVASLLSAEATESLRGHCAAAWTIVAYTARASV